MAASYVIKFGTHLKALREERGLSQEDVADKAGLHRTHISLLERGARSARIETIEKLAIAFELQPSELMPKIKFRKV